MDLGLSGKKALVTGSYRGTGAGLAREGAVGESDILVNNYGVAEGGSWESATADWIDIYQKNVLSAVRLVHAMTPGMRSRGWGRILFVSTVVYARPNSRIPHYYASKTALVNMTISAPKYAGGEGACRTRSSDAAGRPGQGPPATRDSWRAVHPTMSCGVRFLPVRELE